MNKFSSNKIKIITTILGIILVFFAWNYSDDECDKQEKLLADRTQNPTNGIVENKFNSQKLHQIKLKNRSAYIENIKIWNLLKIGDSIYMENDSTFMKIHRQGKVLKLDLKEIYLCKYPHPRIIHKRWINPGL